MQTSLMFLDLKSQGAMSNIQKVAIKMPNGQSGAEAGASTDFSDIIGALMAMAPEKLEKSLGQMDWIRVEGALSEYVPLIDLSEGNENGNSTWRAFLGQIGPEINPQMNPTGLTSGANVSMDDQTMEQVKSALETVQKERFPMAEKTTIENGRWLRPAPDKIDLEQQPEGDGKIINLDNNGSGKDGGDSRQQVSFNERSTWHPADPPQQHEVPSSHLTRQQLAETESKIQSDSEFKPSHDILKQGQTEGMNLKTVDSRPSIKIESTGNGHQETATAQSFGRQLAQNDQQPADAFTRQEAKGHLKFDLQSSNHKPEQLEAFADTAGDAEEATLHGRHIQKDTLHPALQRTSLSSHRGAEHISDKSEWTPSANEIQSNVIRQIVQRMSLRTQGSQSTMSIKLKPEFLGNLHMQVSTDHQQVVVRIAAESVAVKEMIEQGLQYLKTELQHHGLQIDKFDVFVANDNGETNHGQDTAAFQQAFKERRQGKFGNLDNDMASGEGGQKAAVQQVTDASSEIDYFA